MIDCDRCRIVNDLFQQIRIFEISDILHALNGKIFEWQSNSEGPMLFGGAILALLELYNINEKDFIQKENGSVIMTDEGRKKFISAWQSKKQEPITHPFLDEKISWGLAPYSQSLLLARSLRGDLDQYPPFLWK